MKYVICKGNDSLCYRLYFNSVEDTITFLIKNTNCLKLEAFKARNPLYNHYTVSVFGDGIMYENYIIRGIDHYEEEI